ncbi:MAG: hypothetical protein JNL98_04485 [Bryobacterales bacterium]|nr:hypothetical protein [Bryobacterales bacterium]
MRENDRQKFRWQPHTSGTTMAKPREYEEHGAVEADSPYAAWAALRETGDKLDVGDILVAPDDSLQILKYIGFEDAKWHIPEVKTGLETVPPAVGAPPPAAMAKAAG